MPSFPAHIRTHSDGSESIQSVAEHCRNAATYAGASLSAVHLSKSAYLAGLLHDLGKATPAFRAYLTRAAKGLPVQRGSVNHTFAGVRFLLQRYHTEALAFSDVVCELLALSVGAHHGWFDCIDEQRQSGWERRIVKEDIDYAEAFANYTRECADTAELDALFQDAVAELTPLLMRIRDDMIDESASDDRFMEESAFYTGLLARLLLSAVMEGDRRDTAEFLQDAPFPIARDADAQKRLFSECLLRTERKIHAFSQQTDIDRARRRISDQCRAAAELPGGIYRLHVPTGAGKTLSSLRYALAHAARFGKSRIIFTSPLLSILEQNAAVIQSCIQDDSLILLHHSNLVQEEDSPEELDLHELLTETWDAPIVITTLVQLLNTLFSGKTTAIRRFHALCNSVVILDEVQTVPSEMLSLFSLAINFLSEICGATVVLCSATQPCMEQIPHPLLPARNIVPYDPAIWRPFRRTEIRDWGGGTLEEIADLARRELTHAASVLLVCNKKQEAVALYRQLSDCGARVFSLSAAMCMAHRRETLSEMRISLRTPGQKTVCVATQVIEAGIDISFERVIRLATGMDSVMQAAGRCNRNGEAGPGVLAPVYIVQPRGESLAFLPDLEAGKAATIALLTEFRQNPAHYQNALDSDAAITEYYRTLYSRMARAHMDYPVKRKPYTLFSLLARNDTLECDTPAPYFFRQAFRLAGALFSVFRQDTTDVLVSYKEGAFLQAELCGDRAARNPQFAETLLKKASAYSVSLYPYQSAALQKEGALFQTASGAWALTGHYDMDVGFSMEATQELDYLEV